jgi:heptosyltransferase-2
LTVVDPHRCLVVGPSWVGDMVMAQSLFIDLKQQFPQLQIDVLAPAWSLDLLQAMPQVNKGHVLDTSHGEFGLKKRYQLAQRLKNEGYDWSIVLPNSFKSALVPWWAKIAVRTGFRREMRYGLINDMRILDKQALGKTVERFVALGRSPHPRKVTDYPLPKLELDRQQLRETSSKFALDGSKKLLALCPGAEYGPAKRWPEAHYAAVAQAAIRQGWRVVILGSAKDTAVSHKIVSLVQSERCIDLCGKTSMSEVVALLKLSTAAVSNDSGLMHIAAAVDTHLIAIYGSSDPDFTPPLNPTAEIIYRGLECSPCFQRVCPKGHLDCLVGIEPQQVVSSLKL